MKKIYITNQDNTKLEVDLVRYLKFKNDHYLIYTLNEIDEKGYIKLYLVEIMEALGEPISQNIKDDTEWANMKGIVKRVIKEIKSGKRRLLQDLDYHEIEEIKVDNPRFFKLDKKLVDILSSNYLEETIAIPSVGEIFSPIEDIQPIISDVNTDENIQPAIDVTNIPPSVSTIDVDTPVENIMEPIVSDDLEKTQIISIENVQKPIETVIPSETIEPISNVIEEIDEKGVPVLYVEPESQSIIDYEMLYQEAIKAKDATTSMLLNTLNQLQKYQNKYGKLED